MASEDSKWGRAAVSDEVLILVLVEDGFRDGAPDPKKVVIVS